MSFVSTKGTIGSNSSNKTHKVASTRDSLQSKKSHDSVSFTSKHGSKFGRSVSKFPKQNDPSLVQSVSTTNSRVVRTLVNFPVKIHSKLPDLKHLEATECIRELGNCLNILDYEFNYTSFWLLDVLSNLIKHMQLKGFSVSNQNICLSWFRFVLHYISINGCSREEIFSLLQEMILKAEESIKTGNLIPQPEEINILERESAKPGPLDIRSLLSSKSLPSVSSRQSRVKISQKSSKSPHKSSLRSLASNRSQSSKSSKTHKKSSTVGDSVETNLQNLQSLIEMIYSIFADQFMFSMVSQAYSSPTIVTPVEIALNFQGPKQLRPPLILTPPESPKSKKQSVSKSDKRGKNKSKGKKKGSSSVGDTSEIPDKTGDGDTKALVKGKNKGKDKSKDGKGKKKSKHISSDRHEKVAELPDQEKENPKTSRSLEELKAIEIRLEEEKLKLFDRTIDQETRLEMKKIELKDKFLPPLSEGVCKDYVENLIKSLLPPETKPAQNANVLKEKTEGKRKKSLKADKKAKGKKK